MDHPHILPLYGIASDFGRYDAMVCPWFENGSVTKYMERRGDLLSVTDRLQLVSISLFLWVWVILTDMRNHEVDRCCTWLDLL